MAVIAIYIRPTIEQLRWCVENFGFKYAHHLIYYGDGNNSTSRWQYNDTHIYFQNEEDAILFKLRWL